MATRRPSGSGTLNIKAGSWCGRWLVGDHRRNRRLGAQLGSQSAGQQGRAQRPHGPPGA
jgi:hypothetical protein